MSKEKDCYFEVGTVPLHEIVETVNEDGTKTSPMFLMTPIGDGTIRGMDFDLNQINGGGMVISFKDGESGKIGTRFVVQLESLIRAAHELLKERGIK